MWEVVVYCLSRFGIFKIRVIWLLLVIVVLDIFGVFCSNLFSGLIIIFFWLIKVFIIRFMCWLLICIIIIWLWFWWSCILFFFGVN